MARAAVYTVVFFFLAPGTTAGLAAVIACFTRFVTEGTGTPAPTAPTESLVVGGLYRHVRNPMYLAVASVIGGEALLLRSPAVGLWLLAFMALVWAFVRVYEEPVLIRQFGASYERYRSDVPGWWPRLQPYRG